MTRINPYIGPRAFQTGEILYGRDREIEELLDLLIAERIVLLHSPSGAGKSSLVYAGLIPRLQQEGFRVLPTARVSLEPPDELAEMDINCHVLSTLMCLAEAIPDDQAIPTKEMASLSLDVFIDRIEQGISVQQGEVPKNNILIFDQFEEILTSNPAERMDKITFFTQLGVALRNRNRWALFIMREDFVAALSPYLRSIPTRLANTYRLDLLGAEAARQAIQQPARLQEIEFSTEASQRLVDDLRRVRVQRPDGEVEEQLGPYVEPVQLQVVCYRLWENINLDDGKISERDVLSIGNVDTALGDYYAERVAAIARQANITERTVRDWVNRKLITEQGVRGQVLMGAETSEKLPNSVIHLLENAYLVRAEKRGGAIWFELSHDRLIRPVQDNNAAWLNAHLNLLQRQATLWEEREHNEALLLREKALEEAEAWAIAHAEEMTPTEREYLKACQTLRKRESEAKALAEQEIQLQEQAKSAVRLRRRAYGLAAALLVTLILTVVAIFFGNQASLNARDAQANLETAQVASTQEAIQRKTAVVASTLAIAQQALAETASTQAVAQAIVAQSASTQAVEQKSTAQSASTQAVEQKSTAQSASTQVVEQADMARAASTKAVAQANVASTAKFEAEQQRDEAERQREVALSRGLADSAMAADQIDLSLLLSVEAYRITNTIQAENALLTSLQNSMSASISQAGLSIPRPSGYIYSLAWSHDGAYLAWGCDNGLLIVWDINNGRQLWNTTAHSSSIIYTMKFSPDGSKLATGGRDGYFDLWNAKTGELIQSVKTIHGFVLSLDFNPNGTRLVTSGLGRIIQIWDTDVIDTPQTINQPVSADVLSVAWSPNGTYLATAGVDRVVWIWDTASWTVVQGLRGHEGEIDDLAWSQDGNYLASAGEDKIGAIDKTIFIWDINTGIGKALEGPKDKTWSVSFSPDGKLLASGGSDKTVYLWDTKSYQTVARMVDHTHWVTCLAFSPRGRTLLATGGFDKEMYIYELRAPEVISHPMPKSIGSVQGFSFNTEDQVSVVSVSEGNILQSSLNISTSVQQNLETIQSRVGSYAAVSRDGSLVAYDVAHDDGSQGILVLDTSSRNQVFQIDPLGGIFTSAAFSLDNQFLGIGICLAKNQELGFCSNPQVVVWSLQDGKQTSQLPPGHMLDQQSPLPGLNTDSIISLAFSDGNTFLASGGRDGSIVIWSLADQEAVNTISSPSPVTALAFSSNRSGTDIPQILAYGTIDGKLYLWDMESHRAIAPAFPGITGAVTSLQFSPTQQLMFSGSNNGQVLWWDLTPDSWIEKACQLAGRNLTMAEWKQYFPGEEYHSTCPAYPEGK